MITSFGPLACYRLLIMTFTAASYFGVTGMSILWLIIQHCFIGYRGYTLKVPESFEIGRLWNEAVPRLRMGGAMPSLPLTPQWRAQKQFRILLQFCTHTLIL